MSDDLDLDRLAEALREQGVTVTGGLACRLITGGRSNLTYELVDEAGAHHVLRMPPRGSGEGRAHDVTREQSIFSALVGSAVPVPRIEAHRADDEVLGSPFFVAEFVDGVVLQSRSDGDGLERGLRAVASDSIVDNLAAIHAIDLDRTGLRRLGPGEGYLERELRRWTLRAARGGYAGAEGLIETGEALSDSMPAEYEVTLVHGDFKFPNAMIDPASGRIAAILDWELATVGDPLVDLGNLLANWPNPGEKGLFDSPTNSDGFRDRSEVVARYASLTGRSVERVDWYHSFGLWRLAALLMSVIDRYRQGSLRDDFDLEAGSALVADLADLALETLLGERG